MTQEQYFIPSLFNYRIGYREEIDKMSACIIPNPQIDKRVLTIYSIKTLSESPAIQNMHTNSLTVLVSLI